MMSPRESAGSSNRLDRDALQTELRTLERRLRDGEAKVRQAKENGDWVAADRWEAAWVKLLRQYEAVHDRLERSPEHPLTPAPDQSPT